MDNYEILVLLSIYNILAISLAVDVTVGRAGESIVGIQTGQKSDCLLLPFTAARSPFGFEHGFDRGFKLMRFDWRRTARISPL